MPPVDIQAKVAFLGDPAAYPERPARVEVVETHISWVFMTGLYVYKLKKPVRYDFLDFSSAGARRRDCREEVRLNRRFAGDVYIGVVPLTADAEGRLALDGAGSPVDWLVKMHRLPAHRMLDNAIKSGRVRDEEVRGFARTLGEFYREAEPVGITARAYRRRFGRALLAHRRALCDPRFALARDRIADIAGSLLQVLRQDARMFDDRVEQRRIIEAHGDLRPEHICLTPKPVFIDCLEFKREFRILDPADELAFLAVECEYAGAAYVGEIVFDIYGEITGDHPPLKLVHFYKSCRAFLRAKLAICHLEDGASDTRERWVTCTRDYLNLAQKYSLMCG